MAPSRHDDEDEAEDDEFEDEDEPIESIESIGRRATQYDKQIDDQIEATFTFFKGKFARDDVAGKHSLHTVAVFAVHVATLVAVKRHYPRLHRGTFNGFTHALSCRTPTTMPNVKPPPDMFVSYCTIEESIMHRQTDLFEEQGVQPLVQGLLQHLESNRAGDVEMLQGHLEWAAEQARKTYLPFLAEE